MVYSFLGYHDPLKITYKEPGKRLKRAANGKLTNCDYKIYYRKILTFKQIMFHYNLFFSRIQSDLFLSFCSLNAVNSHCPFLKIKFFLKCFEFYFEQQMCFMPEAKTTFT